MDMEFVTHPVFREHNFSRAQDKQTVKQQPLNQRRRNARHEVDVNVLPKF